MRIQKINPIGWANLIAMATAIFTFLFILLFMLFGSILGGLMGGGAEMVGGVMGGGGVMLLLGPILYGVVTWILTIIFALIMNLCLKWIGGLKIEVSE